MRRSTAVLRRLCLPVVVAVVGVLAAVPAHAQPNGDAPPGDNVVEYVSLGDSFAAGTGILPLAAGSDPRCVQSEHNFPRMVAAARGYRLTDVTCARADTESFFVGMFPDTPPQLDALSETTDLVTVMIGGNDNSNYRNLALICVAAYLTRPDAQAPCTDQLAASPPSVEAIEPQVVAVLEHIHQRAPAAEVVIIGYPWLLPETGGCAPAIPVAAGDVPYLHQLQARLNATVARAAERTGTTFVDMAEVSQGHDACAPPDQRWIEPALGFRELSILHPNIAGERAIAEQVLAATAS